MDSYEVNGAGNNNRYTYADAFQKLVALGFIPDAPRPALPTIEATGIGSQPSREVNGDYPAEDPEVLNWIAEGNPNHSGLAG
jgi:hypothetical protein